MRRIFEYIQRHGMIEAGDKVLVGVSGGADSVCLLLLLLEYQKEWYAEQKGVRRGCQNADEKMCAFTVEAAHVEHGVRGQESLADAQFVRKLCARLSVPLHMRAYDVPRIAREKKMSVEEAGRSVRYEAFAQIAGEIGAAKIAVAHHMDDQAETLLASVCRGSGLAGAGAMRPVQGKIIRPLLGCRRSEIEAYLTGRGVTWCHDATNDETAYTRNYLRNCILPQLTEKVNRQTTAHLASLADDMQRAAEFIENCARKAFAQIAAADGARDFVRLSIPGLLAQEEILQEEIVRLSLTAAGCGCRDIGRVHIRAVLGIARGQSGRRTLLPGGWTAARIFESLVISRQADEQRDGAPAEWRSKEATDEQRQVQTLTPPCEIVLPQGTLRLRVLENRQENISPKTYTKQLNYDKIGGSLQLRTRRAGDYLVINREGGRKKLKKYFIGEKIPESERDHILLVAQDSEILWVIGHRMSEAYKVDEHTKEILEIQMEVEEKWQKRSV